MIEAVLHVAQRMISERAAFYGFPESLTKDSLSLISKAAMRRTSADPQDNAADDKLPTSRRLCYDRWADTLILAIAAVLPNHGSLPPHRVKVE